MLEQSCLDSCFKQAILGDDFSNEFFRKMHKSISCAQETKTGMKCLGYYQSAEFVEVIFLSIQPAIPVDCRQVDRLKNGKVNM